MSQDYMKERPIVPLVLSMSVPMVLSMLVNSLYNIVDSYFVAQISEDAMTALSLVYPLQNLLTAVSVGFGVGINAVTAFFLGAGKSRQADEAVSSGLILNAFHGVLLMIGCTLVMPHFLRAFTDDAVIIDYGVRYSNIVFAFSVIVSVGISFEKIFQAVGQVKVAMISMLAGCITNIILDPIFIFGLGFIPAMGIEGAALATGLGQAVTLVIYLAAFAKISLPVHFSLKAAKPDPAICRRLYAVGIPAALNLAMSSLLITALNGILSVYSQLYVLILGVYYKLQTFIYLTANGIVQGIRPLVGYNYGAGRSDRVKSIFRVSLTFSLVIMAVGTLLCFIMPQQLISLFSENAETIREGARALRIISCGFIVSSVSVIVSGTFEGLGKGLPSLIISLIRYLAIIPVAFVLSRLTGPTGVWHAFWVIELTAAVISALLYFFSGHNTASRDTAKNRPSGI